MLFLPATEPNLRAVLSYYSSTVTLDAEGDVHLINNTVEGLGRHLFLESFFENLPSIGQSSRAELLLSNLDSPIIGSTEIRPLSDFTPKSDDNIEAEPFHMVKRHWSKFF